MRNWINLMERADDYPLYHGTSLFYAALILHSNKLRGDNSGDYGDESFKEPGVSLSRAKSTAVRFAKNACQYSNDALSEFVGVNAGLESTIAVLAFDARRLHNHFEVRYEKDHFSDQQREEKEERVLGDLTDVRWHLKDIIVQPTGPRRLKEVVERILAEHPDDAQLQRDMKAALDGLQLMRNWL
jgi:hypothetical protein